MASMAPGNAGWNDDRIPPPTPYRMSVQPNVRGNFDVAQNDVAVLRKLNELLQKNMDSFENIFLAKRHDHIAHHVLTDYALGASVEQMQASFDSNVQDQRHRAPVDSRFVENLSDKETFKTHLDVADNWTNYLAFFQKEIAIKGVPKTLHEHLFAGDEHANRMMVRWFASIFHPVIHLGYAVEYNQPALVAEALAMAAIHEVDTADLTNFLIGAEKAAGGGIKPGKKTLRKILDEARADDDVRNSWRQGLQVELIKNTAHNALDGLTRYSSQYSVGADQVEDRFIEMVDLCACAMIDIPDKIEEYKADFFLLHSLNMLPMWPSILNHPWIPREAAVRLLEWMGRYFVLLYIAERSPAFKPEDINKYKRPLKPWAELFSQSINHRTDDGHLSKAMRALAWGRHITQASSKRDKLLMKDGSTWLKLANLILDSVPEDQDSTVRWLYPALSEGLVLM